ncbi:Asp-tRNA(Asn)/Glu-tRNA(Gln) amidotransferase subunit GatC [Candidatus Saccharibacteria bacterium]|nr:Asp-tRNA(Asn)/Glu-tRNA(Gln) amidotransferase subunit GatC [Candidatus Saccharibacteria bacterium]
MGVSKEEIKHLAELSGLTPSPAELESLGDDLAKILAYFNQLNELDTTDVEPTFQVYEMENVWRADEIVAFEAKREDLLALAPESKDNQIKVPKVL